ncbi:MAG: hypothetical protein PHQ96_07960, partial [Candidatus Omnitrophica bacterium]|nr:hypothetical protein [Candidatus Omnitrophota bacterium]
GEIYSPPNLRKKYRWLAKVFGWKIANRAQTILPLFRSLARKRLELLSPWFAASPVGFANTQKMNNFKNEFPFNIFSNILAFAFHLFIGIWLVPYYIRNLGIASYGFIPLALKIIGCFSFVTVSINRAVSRYLTIDLQRHNSEEANRTFNTAFWALLCLAAVLLFALCVFSLGFPGIFHVPPAMRVEVRLLFFLMSLSFLISIFSNIFAISAYAYNRLDLRNYADIISLLVKTGFTLFFLTFIYPSLTLVGVSFLLSAIVYLFISFFLSKRLAPQLNISFKDFRFEKLKALTHMGGWLTLNQAGSVFLISIDLIIINLFFGPKATGQYGAIIQLGILLRNLAMVLAATFDPMVFISYAKGDREKVVSLSKKALKFMALGMALPIGLLCGFAEPVLCLWLGKDFVKFIPLIWLVAGHLVINLAVFPLFGITTALNKVRLPAIVNVTMGICNLVLAVILSKTCGWGIYGVAAAGALMLTLKNAIFTPLYAAHILGKSKMIFFLPLAAGFFLSALIALSAKVIALSYFINDWLKLIYFSLIICLIVVLLMWFIIGKEDRRLFFSIFKIGRFVYENEPLKEE